MSALSTEGSAPSTPGNIDSITDIATLVLMVRDTLQNGANPTRGNLAFDMFCAEINQLLKTLRDGAPSYADPCRFDHTHSCQTHNYFFVPDGKICPMERIKAILT